MQGIAIASVAAAFAFAAVAFAACAFFLYRESQHVATIYHDATVLLRSHEEVAQKHAGLLMQTSAAISERVDARVRERIGVINSVTGATIPQEATTPLTEAPPLRSSADAETREVQREARRFKRNGSDQPPVRDFGIGFNAGDISAARDAAMEN